jgi:hypothetical protein
VISAVEEEHLAARQGANDTSPDVDAADGIARADDHEGRLFDGCQFGVIERETRAKSAAVDEGADSVDGGGAPWPTPRGECVSPVE